MNCPFSIVTVTFPARQMASKASSIVASRTSTGTSGSFSSPIRFSSDRATPVLARRSPRSSTTFRSEAFMDALHRRDAAGEAGGPDLVGDQVEVVAGAALRALGALFDRGE